jgi:signal peptidase
VWAQRALLALALILLLTLGVLPRLGLYRPVTVLSGSMRPTFSPGDMVVVVPEPVSSVRVGQVISYQVPTGVHQVETHRIVKILDGGAHPVIQTQGDANNWPDPWTAKLEGDTAWRMVAVVPHLGYVVNWLRSRTLQRAAIFVAPALLALLILSEIWGIGEGESDRQGRSARRAERATPAGRMDSNPRLELKGQRV